MQNEMLDHAIARRFRLPDAPTLVSTISPMSPVTISRLKSAEATLEPTKNVPMEDAYATVVLMADLPSAELWLHGRKVPIEPARTGGVFLFSFQSDPVVRFNCPFDIVRFYMSRRTLDELSREAGIAQPGGLSRPEFGAIDPTLLHLASALIPALERTGEANQLFIDYIALAFHSHMVNQYAGPCRDVGRSRSGLSTWQSRRATEMIESRLDNALCIADLASECGLSPSHFSRAFAQSFGLPPHRWLLERRIERAKQLIRANEKTLADIAVACGFATQSHFSRVFSLVVGATPSNWRRMAGFLKSFEPIKESNDRLSPRYA